MLHKIKLCKFKFSFFNIEIFSEGLQSCCIVVVVVVVSSATCRENK